MESAFAAVSPVLKDIKANGLKAALKYAARFDGFPEDGMLKVEESEFAAAEERLDDETKSALKKAAANIEAFHLKQKPGSYSAETMPGVICKREYRPIESVGLYIPGGSAVLPSTMLMLAIPARIAGCRRIVACSPAKNNKVNDALLYAAKLTGVTEFYKIGGAQAIGLMAYGGDQIERVSKIFGPGNQYVTAAKLLVSIDLSGCAIDMPAGPSEVLVIADAFANPAFIAADLLSQAEHGRDSQAVFVTDSDELADRVIRETERQMNLLPRKELAEGAIENSFVLTVPDIKSAIDFSNSYAPEHLILHLEEAEKYTAEIINAGSVFLGQYSPESAGDYASGTNHSLPTYGYARSFGGVTVESFMKSVTFQMLSEEGLQGIAPVIEKMAEIESLTAHKNAVTIRLKK
jgi:histidinol dehydrogenase